TAHDAPVARLPRIPGQHGCAWFAATSSMASRKSEGGTSSHRHRPDFWSGGIADAVATWSTCIHRRNEPGPSAMKPGQITKIWKLTAQFVFGCVVLALVTAACFFLQIGLAATAFCYLIVILLFALMDSFLASALLTLLAVAALDFFSAPPLFDFNI